MAKSITVNQKRGRPVTTGRGTLIGVRMIDEPLERLDAWISAQNDSELTRPEAIRRLVEIGLEKSAPAKKSSDKQRARAAELAEGQIDDLMGTAHPEAASRKRRLVEGPSVVRNERVDRKKR